MNKILGLVLLGVGIALIVWGINASDSVASDVSRFFTGKPTDKSMWLLIGGIASAIAGAVMTVQRSLKA